MLDSEIKKLTTKEVFKKIKDKIEKEYNFNEFDKIAFHGMGGSGIIGDIIKNFFYYENIFFKEVIVNKSYELPRFLNKNWLNIFISYSGKTEETLESLKSSIKNGFKSVFITTNEDAKKFFNSSNYFYYIIPKTEYPPRYNLASLLYSVLLLFLEKEEANNYFNFKDFDINFANNLVEKLKNKIPVIYSDYKISSVPLRIAQQFNENSKKHCVYGCFSEVNHNHLEVDENKNFVYVFLRHNLEHERVKDRFEIVKGLFKEKGYDFVEIKSEEKGLLRSMLYFINLFDYITIKIGVLNNKKFDKNPQIDYLKNLLKKKH
ncbi:MAG TPA: SIS domain-containing protein [Nautiliaceae bacterium]|nr:SIS domain-containing protein [Nautiliaceae bacterium]